MSRNNSVDSIRRKNSIEYQNKPQSNRSVEGSNRMVRNLSNRSIDKNAKDKNQDSNRSIDSRNRQDRSVERAENAKAFMEDISNRVKNIEERVRIARMAMNNRNRGEPRPQKPSDSYQKRYNLPQSNSREKRDNSVRSRELSRNNSIEIKPNNQIVGRPASRGQSERSLSRNRSMERMERQNSRKAFGLPYRK